MIQTCHHDKEISVNVDGMLTETFNIETDIKQGDLFVSTVFSVSSSLGRSETKISESASGTEALENLFLISCTRMTAT